MSVEPLENRFDLSLLWVPHPGPHGANIWWRLLAAVERPHTRTGFPVGHSSGPRGRRNITPFLTCDRIQAGEDTL